MIVARLPAPLFGALLLSLAPLTGCATSGDGVVRELWRVDLDHRSPQSAYGYSLPANANGLLVAAGQDARVHFFDRSGREVRRIAIEAASESGALTLRGGTVVVGDIKGNLYGIDPVAGTRLWRTKLDSIFLGTPQPIGNDFLIQTIDSRIYRIGENGEKRWSYTGPLGGMTMHVGSSPQVADGRIYALFGNGDLVALNGDNGDLLWRRQLILDASATVLSELRTAVADPLLLSGFAYEGRESMPVLIAPIYQGEMLAASAADGSRVAAWNLSLKSAPLLHGATLYAADSNGALAAIDAKSGQLLWKKTVAANVELNGPVEHGGALWLGAADGTLFKIDFEGKVLGTAKVEGQIDRAPLATPDGLVVRDHLGTLYLFQ